MRQLGGAGPHSHQPGPGQRGQHRLRAGDALDLDQRHPPPFRRSLADVGQPQ